MINIPWGLFPFRNKCGQSALNPGQDFIMQNTKSLYAISFTHFKVIEAFEHLIDRKTFYAVSFLVFLYYYLQIPV